MCKFRNKTSKTMGLSRRYRASNPWSFLKNGYSVVKEIGGHGIGLEFHEEPWVGYTSKENTGMLMVPGMIFTIEPMINMGTDEIFLDKKMDGLIIQLIVNPQLNGK